MYSDPWKDKDDFILFHIYSGVSIKIGKIKSLSCKVGEQKATKLWKTPLGISSPRTRSIVTDQK